MNKVVLRFFNVTFLLLLLFGLPINALARWTNDAHGAILSKSTTGKNSEVVSLSLIISYYPERGCTPEVSFILMSGMKLGGGEKQWETSKTNKQLQIKIDGAMFTNTTKVTKYTNGFEYSMNAPPGFIKAMENNPSSILVRLGEVIDNIDFSGAYGFSVANNRAKDNCS